MGRRADGGGGRRGSENMMAGTVLFSCLRALGLVELKIQRASARCGRSFESHGIWLDEQE